VITENVLLHLLESTRSGNSPLSLEEWWLLFLRFKLLRILLLNGGYSIWYSQLLHLIIHSPQFSGEIFLSHNGDVVLTLWLTLLRRPGVVDLVPLRSLSFLWYALIWHLKLISWGASITSLSNLLYPPENNGQSLREWVMFSSSLSYFYFRTQKFCLKLVNLFWSSG
jgi:hypothetical protein